MMEGKGEGGRVEENDFNIPRLDIHSCFQVRLCFCIQPLTRKGKQES